SCLACECRPECADLQWARDRQNMESVEKARSRSCAWATTPLPSTRRAADSPQLRRCLPQADARRPGDYAASYSAMAALQPRPIALLAPPVFAGQSGAILIGASRAYRTVAATRAPL